MSQYYLEYNLKINLKVFHFYNLICALSFSAIGNSSLITFPKEGFPIESNTFSIFQIKIYTFWF